MIEKYTDSFIEQTKARKQETLEFKLTKSFLFFENILKLTEDKQMLLAVIFRGTTFHFLCNS